MPVPSSKTTNPKDSLTLAGTAPVLILQGQFWDQLQSLSARYCHQHIPTQDLSNLFGFPMFPSIKLPPVISGDNAAPIPLQDGPSMERVSRVGLLRAGAVSLLETSQNQTVFMIFHDSEDAHIYI